MMLRSSSTPILGSLLASFSESPNNYHHRQSEYHGATVNHTTLPRSGSQNFSKFSLHSPSVGEIKETTDTSSKKGFRRVQSEGNLEELVDASYSPTSVSRKLLEIKKVARKPGRSNLEAIPSISYRRIGTHDECEDSDSQGGGYGPGGGSGGSYRPVTFDRDGGDSQGVTMEEYYKRVLEENPGNPLFIKRKGEADLRGAEEYYATAILADPEDGEILSQYAKLIWESQHDKERATTYFERAIQASSEKSHIQAAYASFLWDVEDGDEEDNITAENSHVRPLLFRRGSMTSATA